MSEHVFVERLQFSEGIELNDNILQYLLDSIPGSTNIKRASINEDKQGTDYWILRNGGLPPISIDVKHREFCPIERFGSDDACIETTSVYKGSVNSTWKDELRKKPGWTIDSSKRTDLLVYTWPNGNFRRFWILYFPHLCRAAQDNWRIWSSKYGEKPARNNGYLTLAVYPPRKEIVLAMKKLVIGIA